jgi:hypothetical protein
MILIELPCNQSITEKDYQTFLAQSNFTMKPAFDEDRQKRIDDEVLVDTYNHLEAKGA